MSIPQQFFIFSTSSRAYLFDALRTLNPKKLFQQFLDKFDRFLVDAALEGPPLLLAIDKAGLVQLFEMMGYCRTRKAHAAARFRERLFYASFHRAAFVMDQQEDLQPLVIRQRFEYF
jgi:hypothetical protein